MKLWDDPRVARGIEAQLELRRRLLDAGDKPLGWKVGFGSPDAMERLGTVAPLTGFLTRTALVHSGATVSIGGWTRPVAEPEVAVHLRKPLAGGADAAEAREAIGALAPAIELADVDLPPDDPEAILARNVFQRAVVLGAPDGSRAGGSVAGLAARVLRSGEEVAATKAVEERTGSVLAIIRHVGDVLAAFGDELRAGEIVIAGSVVPPLSVRAGDELSFELAPVGSVEVRLGP